MRLADDHVHGKHRIRQERQSGIFKKTKNNKKKHISGCHVYFISHSGQSDSHMFNIGRPFPVVMEPEWLCLCDLLVCEVQ